MTGTWRLLWSQARRDAGQVALWSVGIAVLYWSQAVSVDSIYRTREEFERAAASMEANTAFVAMTGPARALDTTGGQVAWQSTALGAVLVGLMVMLLVGRHTRGAEETGRDELVRAAPVGRFAPVTATLLEAVLASCVVGAAVAVPLLAYPLAPADSIALGVGLAATGWCFAGLALVAAQLTSGVRASYGVVGAALAASYLLRAVGDVRAPALSWLSPIGWYQGMHAFSGLRWWPVALSAAAAVALLGLGCLLLVRRDHGSGLLAEGSGPTRAPRRLRSGFALAWRLHRSAVAGWAAGLLVAGLAYGSIGDDVEDLVGDSATSRALLGTGGVDVVAAFQATSLLMLALIASGSTVAAALRPHAEEEAGRGDPLLTAGVSRSRWWWGHAAATVLGSAVVLGAAGLGLGIGEALATGRWHELAVLAPAELLFLAPALVLAAWTWLWYGVAPGWSAVAWSGPAVAVVVGYLGDLMDLPGWVQAVSPYEHLAAVPAADVAVLPVLAVAACGLLLALLAHVAFLARDLR